MTHRFVSPGMHIDGLFFLTPTETLAEIGAGALVLDIREPYEIMGRTVAVGEVLALRRSRLADGIAELPRDRGIIIVDSTGMRARAAARLLAEHGLERVAILAGGLVEWHRGGHPTDVDVGGLPMGGCACQLKPIGGGQPKD